MTWWNGTAWLIRRHLYCVRHARYKSRFDHHIRYAMIQRRQPDISKILKCLEHNHAAWKPEEAASAYWCGPGFECWYWPVVIIAMLGDKCSRPTDANEPCSWRCRLWLPDWPYWWNEIKWWMLVNRMLMSRYFNSMITSIMLTNHRRRGADKLQRLDVKIQWHLLGCFWY